MNAKSISRRFADKALDFLKENVEEEGLEALARIEDTFAEPLRCLGDLIMQATVESAGGNDVSFLVGHIDAAIKNLASAGQAISVREINEIIEEILEEGKDVIITTLRLAL